MSRCLCGAFEFCGDCVPKMDAAFDRDFSVSHTFKGDELISEGDLITIPPQQERIIIWNHRKRYMLEGIILGFIAGYAFGFVMLVISKNMPL